MTYQQRLYEYEREKKKLQNANLSYKEYEKAIIELANKWRV